jgi:hypothetical protein
MSRMRNNEQPTRATNASAEKHDIAKRRERPFEIGPTIEQLREGITLMDSSIEMIDEEWSNKNDPFHDFAMQRILENNVAIGRLDEAMKVYKKEHTPFFKAHALTKFALATQKWGGNPDSYLRDAMRTVGEEQVTYRRRIMVNMIADAETQLGKKNEERLFPQPEEEHMSEEQREIDRRADADERDYNHKKFLLTLAAIGRVDLAREAARDSSDLQEIAHFLGDGHKHWDGIIYREDKIEALGYAALEDARSNMETGSSMQELQRMAEQETEQPSGSDFRDRERNPATFEIILTECKLGNFEAAKRLARERSLSMDYYIARAESDRGLAIIQDIIKHVQTLTPTKQIQVYELARKKDKRAAATLLKNLSPDIQKRVEQASS